MLSCMSMGWNWVDTAACPRMTARHTTDRQPRTPDSSVHLDRLQSVRRAAGVIPAYIAIQRTDGEPVHLQQCHEDILHSSPKCSGEATPDFNKAPSSCSPSVDELAADDEGKARTTTREPGG